MIKTVKQHAEDNNVSRQSLYQANKVINLPLFARYNDQFYPAGYQDFVVQHSHIEALQAQIDKLQHKYDTCTTRNAYNIGKKLKELKNKLHLLLDI